MARSTAKKAAASSKRKTVYAVIVLVILIAVGLGFLYIAPSLSTVSISDPGLTNVTSQFYRYMEADNPQAAATLWANATPTTLRSSIDFSRMLNSKLGNVTGYRLTYFKVTMVPANHTTEIQLTYRVTRTLYDSAESFILVRNGSTTPFHIEKYSVSSQGLQNN
jgi:hypothetical protein